MYYVNTYVISISLKVVNIAFTFCASLSRWAILCLILFILTLCSVRVPVISWVGSCGGNLTVAASNDWAWRIAATGIELKGVAGLGGGGTGAAAGGGDGAAAAGIMYTITEYIQKTNNLNTSRVYQQ